MLESNGKVLYVSYSFDMKTSNGTGAAWIDVEVPKTLQDIKNLENKVKSTLIKEGIATESIESIIILGFHEVEGQE